ncbi:MAG: 3'-5' exonuclease [Verrucomicrobiales bacterium]
MNREYLPRPDKETIRSLPDFPGLSLDQVIILQTPDDLKRAESELASVTQVGFDTETKPVFLANQPKSGPHLIQLATDSLAILCPATYEPGLDMLRGVIASDTVMKVGFGLKSDRGPLQRLLGVTLRCSQELSGLVQQLGYQQKVGLQTAVAVVLGQHLQKSKRVTTSNWAAPALSKSQILYAANDAYASLRIHQALQKRP